MAYLPEATWELGGFLSLFFIFRLTLPATRDSLLLWLCCGYIVVDERRGVGSSKGRRQTPGERGRGEVKKMKNSGNEAKKWLKTKEVGYFDAANCARFERKLAPIRR